MLKTLIHVVLLRVYNIYEYKKQLCFWCSCKKFMHQFILVHLLCICSALNLLSFAIITYKCSIYQSIYNIIKAPLKHDFLFTLWSTKFSDPKVLKTLQVLMKIDERNIKISYKLFP